MKGTTLVLGIFTAVVSTLTLVILVKLARELQATAEQVQQVTGPTAGIVQGVKKLFNL